MPDLSTSLEAMTERIISGKWTIWMKPRRSVK